MSDLSRSNSNKIQERAMKTQIILQTIDRAYRQLKKHQEKDHSNFIQRISLNLEQDKVDKMLHNLINGYLVIKHSQSTKEPHQKYLYISEDRRFLCWKSPDKDDQKMIELRRIEFIAQSRELIQFRKSSTMKNTKSNCFIILSQVRNLQIQCKSEEQAIQIIDQLQEAIKNSRRMHLSYRF